MESHWTKEDRARSQAATADSRSIGRSCEGEVASRALVAVRAEQFAHWSIDELTYARDEEAEFCQIVKKRLAAPRLTRVIILRSQRTSSLGSWLAP